MGGTAKNEWDDNEETKPTVVETAAVTQVETQPPGPFELIEAARQHIENLPVNDNPTAANAYQALTAICDALENIAKKLSS